ncbi:MAG: hypothetical protein ACTSPQ_22545 [Candidatus Helarchaeota archaeon]
MKQIKKFGLIIFTILLGFTLQFNTSLTEGTKGEFSLSRFIENLFINNVHGQSFPIYNHKCSELDPNCMGVYCSYTPSPVGCFKWYWSCECAWS